MQFSADPSLRIASLLVIVLALAGCLSSHKIGESDVSDDCASFARIDVVSIPYDIETTASIRPESLGGEAAAAFAQIKNNNDLSFVQSRLAIEQPLSREYNCLDTRIACWIHRVNGGLDTLTFCGAYMRYRDNCYQMDTTLLRRISVYLPDGHQRLVEDYIQSVMRKDPFGIKESGR